MKIFLRSFIASYLLIPVIVPLSAHSSEKLDQPSVIIFKNVDVFDGKSPQLVKNAYVLVRENKIESITHTEPVISNHSRITLIDGSGRVLMPGLIDNHYHTAFASGKMSSFFTSDPSLAYYRAGREAQAVLMRGFTSIRDLAGGTYGLKQAIDQGVVNGPRMWVSGAGISQTSGHADFRSINEIPAAESNAPNFMVRNNHAIVADGVAEVQKRVREQLMQGASQIKIMAGGGVTSLYDPIDVSQYSLAEMKAAVEAAENWNTYVTVHAYTPRAVRMAIEAGVKAIEHGHLLDEDTVKLMADKGIWWSLQPFLDDEDANHQTGIAYIKKQMTQKGTEQAYRLAKKHNVKTAFGTDILFSPEGGVKQGKILTKLTRWYSPAELLKMATHDNAELLALSGPRSPYQGRLGVIEQGALADLILVNGNPLENIQLIADPDKNFNVIMKDGKIYKNTLQESKGN